MNYRCYTYAGSSDAPGDPYNLQRDPTKRARILSVSAEFFWGGTDYIYPRLTLLNGANEVIWSGISSAITPGAPFAAPGNGIIVWSVNAQSGVTNDNLTGAVTYPTGLSETITPSYHLDAHLPPDLWADFDSMMQVQLLGATGLLSGSSALGKIVLAQLEQD